VEKAEIPAPTKPSSETEGSPFSPREHTSTDETIGTVVPEPEADTTKEEGGPVFGGGTVSDDDQGEDTSAAVSSDPLDSISQVKAEVEGFVKACNQKIQSYRDQIEEMKKNIRTEEDLLRSKKDEFIKMIEEMQNLMSNFDNPKRKPVHAHKPRGPHPRNKSQGNQ